GFHHRASRHLDGYRDPAGSAVRQLLETTQELGDSLAVVVDAAPSKNLAPGIQNTGPMELRPPIDANKDVKLALYRTLLSRHAPPQDSATAANVAPVLALKRRGLPTGLSATGHPDETRLHIGRYAIPAGVIRGVLVGRPSCLLL